VIKNLSFVDAAIETEIVATAVGRVTAAAV
jgi:hypothetical protein